MRLSLYGGILVFGAAALMGAPASAQETGTPVFSAPYRAYQNYAVGASFSDPGDYGSWALEGFYTFARGPHDFSVRAGFVDRGGEGSNTDVVVGGEFRTRVFNYSETFPFDGALTVGAGVVTGGDEVFLVPVGVTLGRRIQLENSNTTFTPYLHPVLVPTFGGGDSEVGFALGLGVDMSLSSSWDIRVSGGIGDIEGVGISLAYAR